MPKASTTKSRRSPKGKAKATSTRAKSSARKPKAPARKSGDLKRPVSSGQNWLIGQLLGKADLSGGFESPANSAEANAQIRTMVGVGMDATRTTAQAAVKKARSPKGKVKAPIASRRSLVTASKKVRI